MANITVCLFNGIGNTVMVSPLVESLRSLGYTISFLIHPSGKNLVHMVSGFEYSIGKRTTGLSAVPTLWRRCYPIERMPVSSEQILADDLDPKKSHESEANMTIARKLGYEGKTPHPRIYGVKPKENDTIVIATGCRPENQWRKKKYWHWKHLCEMIAEKHKLSFLGVGSESSGWMDELGENYCGKLTLPESIDWIAGSKGMVAIDNGLAHISAALNKNTNVIFGPTLEVKNKPLGDKVKVITSNITCSPCQLTSRWNACQEWECMDIEPEKVFERLVLC